jgi:Tfp pilus assembly protein PilF
MVPFDFQLHSTVADHYLYVAMLGVAICVANLMSIATKRWQILLALVPLLLTSLTFVQGRFWSNTRSLFERAQEVNSTSLAASNQLGLYYSTHGEPERAIGCFEVGCRAHPNIAFVHYNYADVLSKNGALAPALQHYQRAVELDPTQADYWANYGLTLAKADHPPEALAALGQAVKRNPNHADAYLNAGIILERIGQIEEARKAFEQVLRIDPTRQAVREHLASLPGSKPPSGSR